MTSRHCFFNMLREDFRHKLWMLALSVLGNLLTLPVLYLISVGNDAYNATGEAWQTIGRIGALPEFFQLVMPVAGGVIAIGGALITGFFGFRYVFHRNMVDTYHSIPVRRNTLFWVNWLNGFLIWFVPFLTGSCVTLLLAVGRLGTLKGRLAGMRLTEEESQALDRMLTGGDLVVQALITVLALAVVYLLVYHLVLFAVMLCGNLLNAMVTAVTLGVGAISIYGLLLWFCVLYFDTFVSSAAVGYRSVVYASPLASSVALLYWRGSMADGGEAALFWGSIVKNLLLLLGLGALSYLAYRRRPSELAEQGLKTRPVRFLVQIAVSLGAAMGGWLVFWLIGGERTGWGIFGAVLAGAVSFGVLDIIFRMDFKAFFAHKALMGLTVAAGVLIGLMFRYDWTGYDSYLPEQEKIAEIAIYDYRYVNYNSYIGYNVQDAAHPLNRVHIRDAGAAYAFLESAVDALGTAVTISDSVNSIGFGAAISTSRGTWSKDPLYSNAREEIIAKVTLKNGRTYYRSYYLYHDDSEAAGALLSTPEYLDASFKIGQEEALAYDTAALERGGSRSELQLEREQVAGFVEALCRAYDQDLEEDPRAFIYGGSGRQLCTVYLYSRNRYGNGRELAVFEGMAHTREVLREYGFEQMAGPVAPEEVEEIQLGLGWRYSEVSGGELVKLARSAYGVWAEEEADADLTQEDADGPACEAYDVDIKQVYPTRSGSGSDEEIVLRITDREEIAELMELLSYDATSRTSSTNIFRPGRAEDIYLVLSGNGGETEKVQVNMLLGALPEKYILRFGTLQQ